MSQSTLTIYPYKLGECWVFDDPRTGLKEEAFVCGATEMISRLVATKRIPRAEQGFTLTFASESFAGHDVALVLLRPDEYEGNWYHGHVGGLHMECWLCPALYCYFSDAPEKLFVRAESLPIGVNPIWKPPDDREPRRFVTAPK